MSQKLYANTVRLLRSTGFFYATLVVFIVEASWIALSGLYSMAYDENTHLGIIRLYAHHLSPFWSGQPAGPAPFGAISRDPSYLYHYLLSFPYRLIEQVFHTEVSQILVLRFISIALFVLGIIIYRKVLLESKASKALAQTVLAIFVLTPLVPFLAAQINYDNLLFLLLAIALLLTLRITQQLRKFKVIDVKRILVLACLCLLTSLVKYAFLPIFAGIVVYLVLALYQYKRSTTWKVFYAKILSSFQHIHMWARITLISLLLLCFGLFFERYGVNTIKYGTPIPECNQVLSIEQCRSYGPWLRNYLTHQDKIQGKLAPVKTDPFSYTFSTWLRTITSQLLFVLNGTASGFRVGNPLMIPQVVSVIIGILAVLLFLRWQTQLRQIFRLNFFILVSSMYLVILWAQEYSDFRHVGIPVAIQGRYLIPILPLLYLFAGLAYAQALRLRPVLKAYLAWAILGILLLEGGGLSVFILRSDPSWWWQNQTVVRVNQAAQKILRLFVIGA